MVGALGYIGSLIRIREMILKYSFQTVKVVALYAFQSQGCNVCWALDAGWDWLGIYIYIYFFVSLISVWLIYFLPMHRVGGLTAGRK